MVMREEIVKRVSSFCANHKLDFRTAWRTIYQEYENQYHIPVATWYKMGHKSKLDFLVAYEDLYKTLSKLYTLISTLPD